ncbi:MAG: hypothetical protein JWO44_2303 [Bacteroidetes bacterium]|nr:hypothetical protein [Bacteroidota bacterium]
MDELKLKTNSEYWVEKLLRVKTITDLPRVNGKKHMENPPVTLTGTLDAFQSSRLSELCGMDHLNVFTFILTAAANVLNLYKPSEILLLTPTVKQVDPRPESLLFISADADPEQLFKSFFLTLRTAIADSISYQEYNSAYVESKLAANNVKFNRAGIVFKYDLLHTDFTINDLQSAFNISNIDNCFHFSFVYNPALYEGYIAEAFFQSFISVLHAIISDPGQKLSAYPLISEEEQKNIFNKYNQPSLAEGSHQTITDLFSKAAKQHATATAVVSGNVSISYAELDERASALASHLLAQEKFKKGEIIGLLLNRSEWIIVGILGILKAGGIYLPIDPANPSERINYIIKDSDIGFVLTDQGIDIDMPDTITVLNIREKGTTVIAGPEKAAPGDGAYIIYTSGTTGFPKGCIISHRNVVSLFKNTAPLFKFSCSDVWAMAHSFNFDFSVWEIFGALLHGGKLIIFPSEELKDPARFVKLAAHHKITVLNQTPAAFYNLLEHDAEIEDKEWAAQLRYVIFGGDQLDTTRLKKWIVSHPLSRTRLINMFGITETTVHVTFHEIREKELQYVNSNIGKGFPGAEVLILDSYLRLLPAGVPGEIYVGGDGVSGGYLNKPALTKEKFITHPYKHDQVLYRSGDTGIRNNTGDIFYTGRNDDQVQIRGFRVELGEIKNAVLSNKEVKDAVVVALTAASGDKELAAYCILSQEYDLQELRKALQKKLPEYMIPHHFIMMDVFPLTSNGKIDKKSLPLPESVFAKGTVSAAPQNAFEKVLADIWESVLKRQGIGVQDNFFALGGDSIKAIRLTSAINKEINHPIAVKDIYIHQDISTLAAFISARGNMVEQDKLTEHVKDEIRKFKDDIFADDGLAAKLPPGIADLYPMSDIEKGMIFHSLLQPELAVYHDQAYYQFTAPGFEMKVFQRAFALLVEKHEILRTAFQIIDFDPPVQMVFSALNREIGYEDLSRLTKQEQINYLEDFSAQDKRNPFEPNIPGLWRMTVFNLGAENFGMFWVCHHAILDGWSNAAFIAELTNVYFRLKSEPSYTPQYLKATNRDYVIDQMKVKQTPDIVDFWKKELEGYQRTALPFCKAIGQKKHLTITNYSFALNHGLIKDLGSWGDKNNCTVKDICLSAFLYLVYTTTNTADLTIGMVTNGRPGIEDGDKIIGCFLNTIPFRFTIESRTSGLSMITAVKNKVRKLKEYDKLSLVEILKLAGDTTAEQSPLFDLYFNYTDFHIRADENNIVKADDSLVTTSMITNTVFDFIIERSEEKMAVNILYSPELYSPEEILRIEKFYKAILETMAAGMDKPLDTYMLMDESERMLLTKVNDTFEELPPNTTIIDLYRKTLKENSNSAAVLYENEKMTYAELELKANRIANYLLEQGLKKGDVVSVFVERSPDLVASMLGIFKSGGVYLAIPDDIPVERMKFMLADSKTRFLIIKEKTIAFNGITIGLAMIQDAAAQDPQVKVTNEDHAYIVYTSGSTGLPKGVLQHHLCLTNLMVWQEKDLGRNLNILQYAYIGADVSVQDIVFSLISGGTLCMIEEENRRDISRLSRYIVENKVEVVCLQPSVLNLLFEVHYDTFSTGHHLKHLISTGEQLKVSKGLSAFLENNKNAILHNHYGPSETHVVTRYKTAWKPGLMEATPIGVPLINTYISVLGNHLQLLPYGVIGELYLGGFNVGVGYLNLAELTASRFIDDPYNKGKKIYKAGDVGKWMKDGNLEFLGRIDDQVKIRGYRIELGEIEKTLQGYKEIQAAVVVAFTDKADNKYLAAYVTSQNTLDTEAVKVRIKATLPDYMIPAYIVQMDKLPLTANSKVDKRALPDPKKMQTNQEIFKAPENSTEEELKKIWLSILGLEEIGTENNFFEYGGDSIKVIRLFGRIKKELFENIQMADLYHYDTIGKFSKHMNGQQITKEKTSYNEIEI